MEPLIIEYVINIATASKTGTNDKLFSVREKVDAEYIVDALWGGGCPKEHNVKGKGFPLQA
jgi:hypothetical protein